MNPSKRTLLFIPAGDRYIRDNTVDSDILNVLDARLPPRWQILVRLPPTDSVRGLEDRENAGRIVFDRPGRAHFKTHKNAEIAPEDDQRLHNELAWCDCVVSGPSTLAVDAAFFDKPVILVGFDGNARRPYLASIRRYYDYDHFRPILASGGARLVRDADELFEWIERYAAHPEQDRAGRKRIAEEQAGVADGRACERLVDILLAARCLLDE